MPVPAAPKVVYLAGGFHSGWQRDIVSALPAYTFLDPSTHHLEDPKEYVRWDLDAIRRCDIVLANMESSNPGGYALALEVGYAKALQKTILLIDQISHTAQSRYFEMVRQCSYAIFGNVVDATTYLKQLTLN